MGPPGLVGYESDYILTITPRCTNEMAIWNVFNPLRAKFFKWIINIYLHFMSLLHIDMTQVLKILLHVRPGPTYTT